MRGQKCWRLYSLLWLYSFSGIQDEWERTLIYSSDGYGRRRKKDNEVQTQLPRVLSESRLINYKPLDKSLRQPKPPGPMVKRWGWTWYHPAVNSKWFYDNCRWREVIYTKSPQCILQFIFIHLFIQEYFFETLVCGETEYSSRVEAVTLSLLS